MVLTNLPDYFISIYKRMLLILATNAKCSGCFYQAAFLMRAAESFLDSLSGLEKTSPQTPPPEWKGL
jgi:hypothetical protein